MPPCTIRSPARATESRLPTLLSPSSTAASQKQNLPAENPATSVAAHLGSPHGAASWTRTLFALPQRPVRAPPPPRGAPPSLHPIRGLPALRETHSPSVAIRSSHASRSTRFTAKVTACHRDSSIPSCFFPAAVTSYSRARRPVSLVTHSARIHPASSIRCKAG